jgi:hypothetical protein
MRQGIQVLVIIISISSSLSRETVAVIMWVVGKEIFVHCPPRGCSRMMVGWVEAGGSGLSVKLFSHLKVFSQA